MLKTLVLASQIKDNEFLQRENLLLEAYLSKIDFSKAGIEIDDEVAKVRVPMHHAWKACAGASEGGEAFEDPRGQRAGMLMAPCGRSTS
jgi:hypothetical protein